MSIIVLLSPSYFFLFVFPKIIIYKSKTTIFSLQSNMIITSLFLKLTKVSTNNLKAELLFKSVFINCQEVLCHAALEVLRVHYLNEREAECRIRSDSTCAVSSCSTISGK